MNKHIIPTLVVLLLLSSGFVGVSNTTDELMVDVERMEQATATVSGGPMDSPWPMKCHDIRHTSRSPYSTANITCLEKWRFKTKWDDGTIESSAIIGDDGTIYFGSMGSDHRLYALNPNGTEKWNYQVGLLIWSAPAIAEDGTIYVGSWDDYLYAINPNGTRKWRFCAHDSISSSPAIAENGVIYFGCNNKKIYAINPNGTKKWHYTTGHIIGSDPAIGDDGTIYIGSYDNYLYALYPNGTLQWRFGTGGDVKGHPSIADDGTIYVPSGSGYLYALCPNGTMKWKASTGNKIVAASAAIASDGILYVATEKLRAFYPNGTLKWSTDVGGNWGGTSPAISADGTIYVGVGKSLVAVNPNGTERWRKKISNMHVRSSPIIGEDDVVYVGSSWDDKKTHDWYGYLHAFGPVESNSPPETPKIEGPISGKIGEKNWYKIGSVDPDNNPIALYIDWGDGNVGWTLDQASGEQWRHEHTWKKKGNYTIRVKAKDTLGEESDWAYLEVTMPYSYHSNWWMGWLDRFPLLQRLLGWFIW